VKLHTVNKEKFPRKFMGRKGYAAHKEGEKHHSIAARELGDVLGAGEDDLIRFGDETLLLGLGEIGLPKLRGHPAGRRIGRLAFPHLVLVGKAFYAHPQQQRQGGCEEAWKSTRIAAMVAAKEARSW
jgi:hypothetical protein